MSFLKPLKLVFTIFYQTHLAVKKAQPIAQDKDSLTKLKKSWAEALLKAFRVQVEVHGELSNLPQMIFVGNHISYLDIILLLAINPRLSFVAKKEVSHWPFIGTAATLAETIFVSRNNKTSRDSVKKNLIQLLETENRHIVVFPSGTTRIDESAPWRKGIFEVAQKTQVPVQAFRLVYTPLRPVAYIENDTLLTHMMKLSFKPLILARLEFLPPQILNATDTEIASKKASELQAWTQDLFKNC